MNQYKYSIYIYLDNSYGTTGLSFSDKDTAVKKCEDLSRLNGMKYGIFIEYFEDGLHHRRIIWKDGEDIIKEYSKKLSYTADVVFKYIKHYFSRFKKTPTFNEIKTEVQKRDYELLRVLKSLHDSEFIVLSQPVSKNSTIKEIKK